MLDDIFDEIDAGKNNQEKIEKVYIDNFSLDTCVSLHYYQNMLNIVYT